MQTPISFDSALLDTFCERNGIRHLSIFGSVLHGTDRPGSDLDVLVDFKPGERVGYFRLAAMERELSKILGRKVDLRTPNELSPYFRTEVRNTAKPIYVQK